MSELQHCPSCDQEYVGGVPACVECGGPLSPGPLERFEAAATQPVATTPSPTAVGLDRLLMRLPGRQADQAVRALLMEGITCRVECEGLEKVYTPERPPAEPFAVSLPVDVYVGGEQQDAAQEILGSLEQDDLIGEQWSDAESDADAPIELPIAADEAGASSADEAYADGAPEPQGTSVTTAVIVVAVVLVLLFLFGR